MTERWVKMVEKAIPRTAKYLPGDPSVSAIEAAKLLVRQHRAFVRMVRRIRADANAKKCRSGGELNIQLGRRYACDDILAALARQGGGKK